MSALLVGVCGAVGAVARYLVDTGVRRVRTAAPPVATVVVNVTGSLLLGAVVGAADHGPVHLAVGAGFCGGYTTFSTAMADVVRLVRDGRRKQALVVLVAQPVGCVLAAALGYGAAQAA